MVSACADVMNVSPQTISHFQIVFTHLGTDGQTIADDALDVHENIAPGAALENNCRSFKGHSTPYNESAEWAGPDSVTSTAYSDDGPVPVVATITEVDFAGAPSWRAPARL